jgi:hypothetical protein
MVKTMTEDRAAWEKLMADIKGAIDKNVDARVEMIIDALASAIGFVVGGSPCKDCQRASFEYANRAMRDAAAEMAREVEAEEAEHGGSLN